MFLWCGFGPGPVEILRTAARAPPQHPQGRQDPKQYLTRSMSEADAGDLQSHSSSIRDIFFGDEGAEQAAGESEFPQRLSGTNDLLERAYVQDVRSQYSVGWVMDYESPSCMICNRDFSTFLRRHHCRACGFLVCSSCSSKTLPIQGLGPGYHRVCDNCYKRSMESPRPVNIVGTESLHDLLQRHSSTGNSRLSRPNRMETYSVG